MAKILDNMPGEWSLEEVLNASEWLTEMGKLSKKYRLRINPDGFVESMDESDFPFGYAVHPGGKLKHVDFVLPNKDGYIFVSGNNPKGEPICS